MFIITQKLHRCSFIQYTYTKKYFILCILYFIIICICVIIENVILIYNIYLYFYIIFLIFCNKGENANG